jgi:hypothetical protein
LTATVVVFLRCRNGVRHPILWTVACGIAGRKELAPQPGSLVDGVVLELNDNIVAAAAMVPPGQR